MRILFKCTGVVASADLEKLREFHSIDDIHIALHGVDGDGVIATCERIPDCYFETFIDLGDYIRHCINCAFNTRQNWGGGLVL